MGRTELLLLPSESGGTVLNTEGPFFLSLQGLLLEPEFAFRIAWNPWINSSSPPILFGTQYTTQQFQGVSESGGKGQPDSFLLETAVGTFRASGSSCASQIGLLVSWKSFSSKLKEEG